MHPVAPYLSIVVIVLSSLTTIARAESEGPDAVVDVFVGGRDGYPAYRIPSLLTTKRGTLLAIAEGRDNLHDHSKNDIVLKRSTDGGASWGDLQVIAEDGTNALNNPTAVLIRSTARVLLMYQRYLEGFDEHKAEPGYEGPRVCRTFLTHSDDDGVTWSAPFEVTRQVKRPALVTSTASGPGIGIELRHGTHAGRILIPFNQGPYGKWKVYAAFSDDQGKTWSYGETAPEGSPGYANEVQFAELPDGTIMLNARNQGGDHRRKIALSRDGGRTWSATWTDPVLVEPICQASLLRHSIGPDSSADILLFSNPASTSARTNGTIRLSRDGGKTWPSSRMLYSGGFAYSCLGSLADGSIGCLFERDNYGRISFKRFSVAWIMGE